MKQILALLLATLGLFSCQNENKKDSYTIEGDAVGFADGSEIFVHTVENKQTKVIDTLIVKDGKFSATYPNDKSLRINFLRPSEVNGSIIYFPENENMTATLYKDSIQASRVMGGAQNEAYSEYIDNVAEFNKRKQASIEAFRKAQQENNAEAAAKIQSDNLNLMGEETKFKKKFLNDHDKSLFSIMLLSEMVSRGEITANAAKEYLNDLSPELAASEITQDLKTALNEMGKAEVGVKAPDFSATTPDGDTLSLYDALGKCTIIDFWASWCKPCRVENPNVVKVYNKYHDKGLNIISVSLDKAEQKDKWIQAIKDDNMDWYHISNLKFWNDPIAKQYNVRSIPATFLLDENGIIIDKDLRGAALEAKIGSLLGD